MSDDQQREDGPRGEVAGATSRAVSTPAPRFELMPETFPRSARDLESDGFRWTAAALGIAAVLLCGWFAWLSLARVSLVVSSDTARVEVGGAARPVEARVGGLVAATNIALNQEVAAGDLLVELESATEQLLLKEQRAVGQALDQQLSQILGEIAAQGRSLDQTDAARRSLLSEARAQARASESAAQLAELEAGRSSGMRGQELISAAELLRQQAAAVERRAEASGRRFAVERLRSERHAVVAGMSARLAELNREAEQLRGQVAASALAISRLERAVEDRRIRAPVAGRVVDVADVHAGQVVDARTSFGTILPAGPLKVVASFAPSGVVGRVRIGQRGRLTLDGFPWVQYGTVAVQVTAVGVEPRNGRLRVELGIASDGPVRVPLQHGLTGAVEVDIERVSPFTLVIRTVAGHLLPHRIDGPPPAGSDSAP